MTFEEDFPGPVHNLAQTVSQILTAYIGTELRSRGQIADKNGPGVGVNRPVRLHAASFRKPNQIGLHSREWLCLGNANVPR